MPRSVRSSLAFAPLVAVVALAAAAPPDRSSSARRLVVVNGEPITEAELEFLMLSRRIPDKLQPKVRKQFLEDLIDRRLMRAWLARREARADEKLLDERVAKVFESIRKSGNDPVELLAKVGYTEKKLREELALPLAWRAYVRLVVTDKQLREHFAGHREEFDGTQVRASQIVVTLPRDASESQARAAEEKLRAVRSEVVAGRTTFTEAARKHSTAPSREQGGDLGFFRYRGKMPLAIARVAFSLKKGEVSEPFATPFGVHLVTVTDRKPGMLSLEDVRGQILDRLADDLWSETVRQERAKATIERVE